MKLKNPASDAPVERINSTAFNSKLAAAILHEYYTLYENNKDKLEKTGVKENGANQAFYDWQVRGGWQIFMKQPEFQQLMQFFQTATDIFLNSMGIPQVSIYLLTCLSSSITITSFPT